MKMVLLIKELGTGFENRYTSTYGWWYQEL